MADNLSKLDRAVPPALPSALQISRKENGMSVITPEQLRINGMWRVDPAHSSIEFRVRHLMIESVKGRFLDFDGAIEAGQAPSIVGSIRVASLNTHHRERDLHLCSSDFFDAERHPEMSFSSTRIDLAEDGSLDVAGELTIKEVTRPVQLSGMFHGVGVGVDGSERIAFELRGELNRLDYDLTWNRLIETGGIMVGNTVELALDVAAVRDVAVERAA
jgi:polyisoprenoid-binding protein YceI